MHWRIIDSHLSYKMPSFSKILILQIEDNPGDITLLHAAFKKTQFEPSMKIIKDGQEAIEYLNKVARHEAPLPDLILLDINLPSKSGFEVLQEVKDNKAIKKVPVIVLSSSKNPRDIQKAYENKAECFITKSFEFKHFVDFAEACRHFAEVRLTGRGDPWEKFNCHENSMRPEGEPAS